MQPNEGFFAHGGSENNNHGPIRCACLDLSTGEVVFDEDYQKRGRLEMACGTACDAATISILSAVILCHKKGFQPVIYAKDPNAIKRAKMFLQWARTEEPPTEYCDEREWHPMILQAMKSLDFDTTDVELRRWDKNVHGENPLARGRWG